MKEDLALHALEGIVDRFRVAPDFGGHVLVRQAFEVEAKCIRLEGREPCAEREHQALELLGGDDAQARVVDTRAGQRVTERAIALTVLSGRCMAERDVRVERRVLEASGRLYRRDDLPCN